MIFKGKVKITSPFGYRDIGGGREFHSGIDCVGLESKEICAVRGGTVVVSQIITDKSNLTWQWGNYICIRGDDRQYYYYCHMSRRIAQSGDCVKAGDVIGIEGNTGYSFGSHCHFEVRNVNNTSIDPSVYLGVPNKTGEYGYNTETEENDVEKKDNTPSEWAEEAVRWAIENGIVYGDENGDLMLREPCTREQMLVFLYRLHKISG